MTASTPRYRHARAGFDALTAARDLKAAGVEAEQAEAIAEGMRRAAGADRADLATKTDLADLETRLRAATKADIETLRSELRWMLGFLAALIFAMAAKLFGIV